MRTSHSSAICVRKIDAQKPGDQRLFSLPIIATLLLLFAANHCELYAQIPTPLYINFVMHSDEGDFCPNERYGTLPPCGYARRTNFVAVRAALKNVADTIRLKGAKWNWQSDWTFLNAVIQFDEKDASTQGKNIVRWLYDNENYAAEVDARAEETTHNYSDVTYFLQLLGVPSSKIVGGFTYNAAQGATASANPASSGVTNGTVVCGTAGGYTWDSLAKTLKGRYLPDRTWTPQVLTGAAAVNSATCRADLTKHVMSLGVWQPQRANDTDFFRHDPQQKLVFIGGTYPNSTIDSGSSIQSIQPTLREITSIVDSLQRGLIPGGKMYSYTINLHQHNILSAGYIAKISALIDSLKPYTQQRQVVWATFHDKISAWRSVYNEQPNAHPYPTQIVSVRSEPDKTAPTLTLIPNPSASSVNVVWTDNRPPSLMRVAVVNSVGVTVLRLESTTGAVSINTQSLATGAYIVEAMASDGRTLRANLTVQR